MKRFLFILILLIGVTGYSQECDINPNQALEYLGKEATVCGEIFQVFSPKYTKGNPTYLNMGGKFPNHTFTIVIWDDSKKDMNINLEQLLGKNIAVTGMVREYDDKPQIVVKSESQLSEW